MRNPPMTQDKKPQNVIKIILDKTRFVMVKMGDAESKHRYALCAWQVCKNSMLPDRLPFVVKPNQESARIVRVSLFCRGSQAMPELCVIRMTGMRFVHGFTFRHSDIQTFAYSRSLIFKITYIQDHLYSRSLIFKITYIQDHLYSRSLMYTPLPVESQIPYRGNHRPPTDGKPDTLPAKLAIDPTERIMYGDS
jgi:hypothetical protein